MLSNFLRKLASFLLTLFVLASFTFFLLHIVPGGPFDSEKALPSAVKESINEKYGLNLPLWQQYQKYIRGALSGDFGPSLKYFGRDVSDVIAESLPVSLKLGALALLWAVPFGLLLGISAAKKPKGLFDYSVTFFSVISMSMPAYLVAAALVYLFCIRFDILPPALWENWRSMILPVITLGLRPSALVARLTRSSLLETMNAQFVRTGRAKGLSETVILWKHSLRNSILPVISLLGPLTANLLTGSFVVEFIFAIPGMGKYFIDAVSNRDYPLVMGLTMIYGFALVLCNMLVDLSYAWVDPRIRTI